MNKQWPKQPQVLSWFLFLCVWMAFCVTQTSAQVSTTGEIRGTVVDATNARIPNAEVKLIDAATGSEKVAQSGSDGGFVFVRLQSGPYRLTVGAPGFQNTAYNVVVETARVADVTIRLTPGAVTETVEVKDAGVTLETSSSTVSNTIRNEALQDLPLPGRDVLSFALLTAGAQRGSSDRSSTFNGLPNASLNITLDGVNNNSQRFKSGGTSNFVFAPLRLGAIEEVTVSTTGMGADAGGEGAMQMRFVTKRGTNQWHGSVVEQFRNDALNANNWFNNARGIRRPVLRLNEFGGNIGGPLWKNKLFFFINYEHLLRPSQSSASNQVLTTEAQRGIFRYLDTSGAQRTVNLFDIARANNFPTAIDPTVTGLLTRMNNAASAGTLLTSPTDLIRNSLTWNLPGGLVESYPTARLDYQITPNIAFTGTWNLRWRDIKGTQPWPGPDFKEQSRFRSTYYIGSTGVNWAITPTTFNEFKFGVQSNVELFNVGEDFDNFQLAGKLQRISLPLGIPSIVRNNLPIPRNNPVWNIYDNLNLIRGKHTYLFGGSYRKTTMWESIFGGAGIPTSTLGTVAADPVTAIFNTTTLPGVRTVDLTNAWNLYGLLTGRLTDVRTDRPIDENDKQYRDLAPFVRREKQVVWGLYFQDSWRVKPSLTLNYGLRWEFSGDIHNTNGIYTNPTEEHLLGPSRSLFKPGTLDGVRDPQIFLRPRVYDRDYVNPAPNFGFAWNPKFETGLLNKIFGNGKGVLRGAMGVNYYDEGMLAFQSYAGVNPGLTQFLTLVPGVNFAPGSLTLGSTLPAFDTFPTRFAPPFAQSLFTFRNGFSTLEQNLRTPYVVNWSFGIQREFGQKTVVEARYVGNKASRIWRAYDLNEVNIFENGFLQEFTNAQRNLQISQTAGVANFANRGLPGQVALPIFEAAFGARGGQAALPAGSSFTNGTFVTLLQQGQAGGLARSLAASPLYLCRMAGNTFSPCAGLGYSAAGPYASNFFQANPFAAGQALNLVSDISNSSYNGLQLEVKRALSHGLMLSANYTWSKSLGDLFAESATSFRNFTTHRNRALDKGPSVFDIRHVFQVYGNYDLPFGKGHRLSGNSFVNGFIGDWSVSVIARLQSGRPFRLASGFNTVTGQDSGVILNGVTVKQLQEQLTIRSGPQRNISFVGTNLVAADGRANPGVIGTPTTPGQFGQFVYLYGPRFTMFDAALRKDISLTERIKMTLFAEFINALNHPVFSVGGQGADVNINATTFGQTTALALDPRNIQFRLQVRF